MKILKIEFKNFSSYGNKLQKIEFSGEQSKLWLVRGNNGSGKCLHKSTEIEVDIENNIIKKEFLNFLKNR